MSYYPFWSDFKNLNPFDMYYPFQIPFQNQFFVQNQLFLQQSPIYSPLLHQNHQFSSNFSCKKEKQFLIAQPNSHSENPLENKCQNTLRKENINGKIKREKFFFKQKEGRNMISNLFRQALKLLLIERSKTIEIIQKIALKYNLEINAKEFIENLIKKTKNLKNYVRVGQIEQFLKGKQNEKSRQHAKILRILINQILREDIIPCLCNNPKVSNINRTIHIIQRRKLQNLMSS